jgi:NO-binding membrane sensor protein with MHYT domain
MAYMGLSEGKPVLRVLACLRYEHDYRLVLLAICVCVLTVATAFYIHGLAAQANGIREYCWIFLTGLAAGCGIWTTHFVAMLAFSAGPFPVSYDPFLTFASLLIAILFTAVGFWFAGPCGPW